MNKKLSEQSDWNELLDFITDRQLTPILGKELYKFKDGGTLAQLIITYQNKYLHYMK